MQYRTLGRTGWNIATVGAGCWAIGDTWGKVDDSESIAALHKALDLGCNFFDTADVYGDGHSEEILAKVRSERKDEMIIATKIGRRLNPHTVEGYNRKNLTAFVERNLKKLDTDALDLVQLHCPPTEVYYMPEVFGIMDDFVKAGKIKYYGVSVEKVEEALKAIEYPNVQSVQIIFNMFRQRPAELFFQEAKRRKVGILARIPLSSGMLAGKMSKSSTFENDDHRKFNRNGELFDRGETFSGVDFELGLKVVEEIRKICPANMSMAQFAIRWILMHDAVTTTIPGIRRPSQSEENFSAADLPAIDAATMTKIREIYDTHLREAVHYYW